ncbi:hypothetical protein EII17_09555 [Clostridiales bacterium COT073_COT-073]|nr:hypothetical protein EII17_09555 [Clostridiales bacterium COT073_COT-073]
MLKLFILVFFSSLAVGAVFLLYLLTEHFFQRKLNLQTKSLALTMILFLQPMLILLTITIVVCGIHFQKKPEISTNLFLISSTPLPFTEISESKSSVHPGAEVAVIDLTTLITLANYAAYIWFTVFMLLLTYKVILYSKLKHLLMKSELHLIPYHDIKLKIYKSKSILSPFLIGFFKPFIVIPDVEMSEFELSLIIEHEKVHFQNQDIPLKMTLEFLKCLNWFQPLFYTLQKKFHYVAELITDDIVTMNLSTAQRKEYGMLLLKFTENLSFTKNNIKYPGFYSYLSEDAKNLADRLEFIMKKDKNKRIGKFALASMIIVAVLSIYTGVSVTSEAYANAAAIESNFPDKSTIQEASGKLIYDDGNVQIFDGSVDENATFGLAEESNHQDLGASQPKTDVAMSTNQQTSMTNLEEMRKIVLQENEYRTDANLGDSIYSLCNGTVISAKFEQGYGNCVTIQDEDGLIWKYGFCSELVINSGDSVFMGDLIGYAGHSGFAERDSVVVKLIRE